MLGRGGGMMGRPATEGRGRTCTGQLPHLLKHASMLLVDSQVHLQPALSQAEGQLSCPGRRGFGQAWQGRQMVSVDAFGRKMLPHRFWLGSGRESGPDEQGRRMTPAKAGKAGGRASPGHSETARALWKDSSPMITMCWSGAQAFGKSHCCPVRVREVGSPLA